MIRVLLIMSMLSQTAHGLPIEMITVDGPGSFPHPQSALKHVDGDRAPSWSLHTRLLGDFSSVRSLMDVPYPSIRDPWVRLWANLPEGYAEQFCSECSRDRVHYVTGTPNGHEIWLPEDIGREEFIKIIIWYYQKTERRMSDGQLSSGFAERERDFYYDMWAEIQKQPRPYLQDGM